MRILNVDIQDFRSIRSLSLSIDNPLVILEGKNDVGKSNILLAIDLAFRHAARLIGASSELSRIHNSLADLPSEWPRDLSNPAAIIRQGAQNASAKITVAVDPEEVESLGSKVSEVLGSEVRYSFRVTWTLSNMGVSSQLSEDWFEAPGRNSTLPFVVDKKGLGPFALLLGRTVRHIGTRRHIEPESFNAGSSTRPPEWNGWNFKNLLFAYKNDPSPEVQARFQELVQRCSGTDFHIGQLSVGLRGQSLFASTRQGNAVHDLEERASGIQQLVILLALSICHGGTILSIEEPELNLSTSLQRALWSKLQEFVGADRPLRQVFVTSHSPVFEAASERWTVTRGADGFTAVERAAPPPSVPEDVTSIHVGRDGDLSLPVSARTRLRVPADGGDIILSEGDTGVEMLSVDEFAKRMQRSTTKDGAQ